MKIKEIKDFIELAKNEGVTQLSFEDGDKKFSVSFENTQSVVVPTHNPVISTNQGVQQNSVIPSVDGHMIKAPFVGTFYESASPGKPALVKVGDKVSKGQTLCILEAMKIMNEIESDVNGEVVEVCLSNESLVEFGEPLFKIRVS